MAIVRAPLFSAEVSGKVGPVEFHTLRGRTVVGAGSSAGNPRSPGQLRCRNLLRAAQHAWDAAPGARRSAWIALDPAPGAGRLLFITRYIRLTDLVGPPSYPLVPAAPYPPLPYPDFAFADHTYGTIVLTFNPDFARADYVIPGVYYSSVPHLHPDTSRYRDTFPAAANAGEISINCAWRPAYLYLRLRGIDPLIGNTVWECRHVIPLPWA